VKPVVIVGGGLSGLAAGVTLSTGNTPLLLFEQKPFLGGRAYSFRDRETGELIDNGQHLLIVGYRRTLELLRTIGTVDRLFIPRRPELLFHHPVKGFQTLRLPRLVSPLHVLMGVLRCPLFSGKDLRALLRAGVALGGAVEADVARMSIREWLAAQRQPEETIRSFWEPLALSIMNENPEVASALLFLRSMRIAFFGGWRNAAMAIPTVGLSELFADPASDYIRRHGGDVRTHANVVSLVGDENGVTGVRTRDGALHQCGAVILAVPPERAEALLRVALCGRTQFLHCSAYAYSPIVSLHLWFESDFVPQSMVGLIGRRIQWVCNRRRMVRTGTEKGGHLSATISAARSYASLSNRELLRIACDDLTAVYGSAAERLIRGVVIRERRATVSLTPELEPLRPGPELPIRNVFLAGDWTATGYPATIEGAVTSGERAAMLALRSLAMSPREDPAQLLFRTQIGILPT
jgi:zeta-carotene desaturase